MTTITPPVVAFGGMTMDQLLDLRTPPRSPEAIERERLAHAAMMAYSRESMLKAQVAQLENAIAGGVGTRGPEPPPEFGPYDPLAPDNNTDPGANDVTFIGMPGHQSTALHEISFLENAIAPTNYPLDTVTVYLGTTRSLTQVEVDYLNARHAP